MTNELCAKCGHPRAEHSINGACYGLGGEFAAPHPAPDATEHQADVTPEAVQRLQREADKDLAGKEWELVDGTAAPDATDWKARCEAPRNCSCHPSEVPVPCQGQYVLTHCLLSAAQVENEKLRRALREAIELANQDQFVSGATLARWVALSPPSLSPETP